MNEKIPIQKEFGEIDRQGMRIKVRKFGASHKEELVNKKLRKEFVGVGKLREEQTPINHLLLTDVDVTSRQEQGKGFASQIMSEVEKYSKERNLPVALDDAIDALDTPDAIGMYGKRPGWIHVENKDIPGITTHIYGEPNDPRVSEIADYYRNKKFTS